MTDPRDAAGTRDTPAELPFEPGELRVLPCLVTTAGGGLFRLAARSWVMTELAPEPAVTLTREGGRLELYDIMDLGPLIGERMIIRIFSPGREAFTLRRTSPVVAVRLETIADRLAQLAHAKEESLQGVLEQLGLTPERLAVLGAGGTPTAAEEHRILDTFGCTRQWLMSGDE